MTVATAIVGATFAGVVLAQQPGLPPEAKAVQKYILESDYPELFDDTPYETQIEDLLIADFDNDGMTDVVVHFSPHFRQSATVVFYKINDDFEVRRIAEGLAPGPIQAVSGTYLDSHVLGAAADISIGEEPSNMMEAREKMINAVLANFGSVVSYENFFHVDSRAGGGAYLDLTHIPNLPGSKTCEEFEFSHVDQVAIGPLKGGSNNHLAAWVGNEIWIYRIDSVRDNGLFEKNHWIQRTPDGFLGFIPGEGLNFSTAAGESNILSLEAHKESSQR